jgi:hypothetical protein
VLQSIPTSQATQEQFGVYLPHDQYAAMQAASLQRAEEYLRKKDELCASEEMHAELEQVMRALSSRVGELAALVDDREKVASEAEEFGKVIEQKFLRDKSQGN